MIARVRAWLAAVPGRDALERRQAYLLEIVLLVVAGLFLAVGILSIVDAPARLVSANLVAGLLMLGLVAVLRRGHFRLVAASTVGLLVIGFSLSLASGEPGLGASYLVLLMLPVVLAGIILPRLAAVGAALLVLVAAELAVGARVARGDVTLVLVLPNFRWATLLIAIIVDQFGGTLRAALERATAHEQELEDARAALQARTAELQEAVAALETEISERAKGDEERRAIEAKVLEVQKLESLGVLAGGIAHDFNNLLVGIMGNAGLALMDLPPGSPARESIQHVETAARRAADLAREMLAYSGKGRFVVAPLDLSALVRDMAQLLHVSIGKTVVLKYDLATDPLVVEADATQLRQVVMNLVINASDSIGEESGVITLATGRIHADRGYLAGTLLDEGLAEGEYAFLEVSDTGAGMDAETQARIFDPFFTTKFTGRGLGLAAVLGIARGHRGAIKVYSEPGRGTTMKLLLPTVATAPAVPDATPAAGRWRAEGTILVADDEPLVRDIARTMLSRMGLQVVVAVDGEDAVERFSAEPDRYHAVLLDLTMPKLSGVEVFRRIRAIRPDAPVVLMSGYSEDAASGRFAGKGLAGFLEKPFSPDDLTRAMRAVFEPLE